MQGTTRKSTAPLGAIIADSDRLQRGSLVTVLEQLGFEQVADVGTAREALLLAERLRPRLTLVAPRLPDDSDFALVRALAEEHPGAVVLVAGELGREETLEALSAGARGVVSKRLEPDAFSAVVEAALTERAVLVPADVTGMLGSLRPTPSEAPLSGRELEVLALLVRGRDNAAIAAELHISPSTAKGHVSQILHKLRSENRVEAAVKGVRQGLVRL